MKVFTLLLLSFFIFNELSGPLNIYTQISYTGVFAVSPDAELQNLNHYSYDIQGQAHGYLFHNTLLTDYCITVFYGSLIDEVYFHKVKEGEGNEILNESERTSK